MSSSRFSVNWPSLPDPTEVWYLTDTNQVMSKQEIEAQGLNYGVIVVTPDGNATLGTATEAPDPVDTGPGQAGDSDSDSDSDSDADADSDTGGDSATRHSQA